MGSICLDWVGARTGGDGLEYSFALHLRAAPSRRLRLKSSARVVQFSVEAARGRGVPVEQLLEGLDPLDAVWAGRRRWYDWSTHVRLLDRFEQCLGGPDAAEASASSAYAAHVSAPLRALVAFWGDPPLLYRAGFAGTRTSSRAPTRR